MFENEEKNEEIDELVKKEKQGKTWREKMVVQAIICGVLLSTVLGFSVIDTAFTNNVSSWVEENIAFDFLAQEDGVGAWTSRVVEVFRGNDATGIDHAAEVRTPQDSWFDQSILDEMNE